MICLILLVIGLSVALFAIDLEAVAPGTGVVIPDGLVEIPAPESGIVTYLAPLGAKLHGAQGFALLKPKLGEEGKQIAASRSGDRREWLLVKRATPEETSVQPGQVIATLQPLQREVDGRLEPIPPIVRLAIEEKHFGAVRVGQAVRLSSTMYPPRVHGIAEGEVIRLEPFGEEDGKGGRRFHAIVRVTHQPFPLLLGASVKGEVILGRKVTYRIIMEH